MCPLVAPRPPSGQMEQFGFIVGEEGIITVQIHANPKPMLTWTVDYERIPEGSMDTTQRFQADRIREMVCIHNFFNLHIYIYIYIYILKLCNQCLYFINISALYLYAT
jgi:hypothetical protein